MPELLPDEVRLAEEIARVLDECRLSHAVHPRKLKELSVLRSTSGRRFFHPFARALSPLFDFPRRTVGSERAVRFVSAFTAAAAVTAEGDDGFSEEFLRFLLVAAGANHRPARMRACQIISEIIMRLPDDAEVSDEVWDEVIDIMKQRIEDKVPAIRVFAVRALSRFANEGVNDDTLNLLLQALPQEHNAEVRKTLVLSMPPSNETSAVIVASTLDVSETVRKAAYCVLASKFPLQSLSIKLRNTILQRGLADRSLSVTIECLKMLKDEWLTKCCGGNIVALLRFLDVETYESVGEAVMDVLLKDGAVRAQEGKSIRQYLTPSEKNEGGCTSGIQLMEPEIALYWKTLCRHLQTVAHAKGSDAASATGTEAAVYASEASDSNDLLEEILPLTVSDYVELVKAHLSAGPNYRFASRQLLLLGVMLDFSDTTNRKVASSFLQELLLRPLDYEEDHDGNKVILGDGISLGGDKDWARAVSELAKKVHSSVGEFEALVTGVVEELARPCRERAAGFIQWMHCLSVTGVLLENIESLRNLRGEAIEPNELLHSLLLPGAKQVHVDVQRVASRCLCLFGLLERTLSEDLVKQLRLSFINGPVPVSIMATKALIDLAMWHGPQEVDKAIGIDIQKSNDDEKDGFNSINLSDLNDDMSVGLLDLLFAGLDREDLIEEDEESVHAVLGEGFAKILLLSENYLSIPSRLHPLILCRLVSLYFSDESNYLQRLKQCLSVFFEHYPALSLAHKKCVSRAFIPFMRSMWPGIYGNPGGSTNVVSKLRKRAIQASRFLLQMMQMPLFSNECEEQQEKDKNTESVPSEVEPSLGFESSEEGLALRIAAEVANFPEKKNAAEKSYVLALCRIALLIQFRPSEQDAVKCMRGLLNSMIASAFADKDLVKDLTRMAARLRSLDKQPDQELSQEQASSVLGKLGLDVKLKMNTSATVLPPTPAPRSTRAVASTRRRTRHAASDEDDDDEVASSIRDVPATPSVMGARSQRASKTAAMSKMTSKATPIEFSDEEAGGGSDVTSEDTSDDDACDEHDG